MAPTADLTVVPGSYPCPGGTVTAQLSTYNPSLEYEVRYRNNASSWVIATDLGSGQYETLVGDIDSSGTIEWKARAKDGSGFNCWTSFSTGPFDSAGIVIDDPTLTVPPLDVPLGCYNSAINVFWTPVTGDSYEVEYSLDGLTWNSATIVVAGQAETTIGANGTIPGGTIDWRIRSKDAYSQCWSLWSATSTMSIVGVMPYNPSSVTMTPEPRLCCFRSLSGTSPKKRSKKSS